MSDQPESIAVAQGERDIIKRAYHDALLTALALVPDKPSSAREQGLAEAAVARPVDREIDRKVARNDRGQGNSPSEPIRNAPSKAGVEVERHEPPDDRASDGEPVAQKRRSRTEHWRAHHLDQMKHEIVRDDWLCSRAQLMREPEYRRHEHQNLNDVADERGYITKSRAYHAEQYRHPRSIHGHNNDTGDQQ